MMKRTLAGGFRHKREVIKVWMTTDFPEPGEPAMRRCGARARLAKWGVPAISRPIETKSGNGELLKAGEPTSDARPTVARARLGISMPTSARPGIGASMRRG